MKKKEVETYVAQIAASLLPGTGLTLVDVEYVREKEWYLRVYIDKPTGIGIDDCQMVSEKITAVLDRDQKLQDKFNLEVSSPGIDRPLKSDRDLQANYGKKIDLVFYAPWNGLKKLTAILENHTPEQLLVRKIIKGKTFKNAEPIARNLIADIRPHLDF